MGAEVSELFTMATAIVDPMFAELGDVDTSVVSLRFASGGLGFIDTSRRSGFGYDMRTEIFGSKSSLFIGYQRETALLHLSPDGVRSDHVHWFLDRFGDAYVEELRAFVDCLVRVTPPPVDGNDARAALALAYAAEASRREHGPVSPERFARQ
jgi:predicted dehydrogenase